MTPSLDRARGTPDRAYTRMRRASFLPEQVAKGSGPSLTVSNRSPVRAPVAGRGGVSVESLREMSRVFPEMRPAIRAFFPLETEIDAETERMLAKIMALAARKT